MGATSVQNEAPGAYGVAKWFLQSKKNFKKFQARLKNFFTFFFKRPAHMNGILYADTGTPPGISGKSPVIPHHPRDTGVQYFSKFSSMNLG